MNRRLMLTALAITAASPALAQQRPVAPIPANPQPTQTQPNEALGTNVQQREQRTHQGGAPQDTGASMQQDRAQTRDSTGAPARQQSRADADYIQQTLAAGTVTLQASTFARTKAHHPRVQQFAAFEEEEQNTLTAVLRSLAEPTSTASTGQLGAAATAPVLSPEASATMERLSRAQAGPGFDRDYVQAQIQGHQNLLQAQKAYLEGNPQNREITNIARLAQGRIQEHLILLQDIAAELGR